jgi:hypothetical protein
MSPSQPLPTPEPFVDISPDSLAADDHGLYFTDEAKLYRVDKAGGPVSVLYHAPVTYQLHVTLHRGQLYWVHRWNSPWADSIREHNPCELMSMPTAGGAAVSVASKQRGILAVAVDDLGPVWLCEETPGDVWDSTVRAILPHRGLERTLTSGLLFGAHCLALDAAAAYVLGIQEDGRNEFGESRYALLQLPRDGGSPRLLLDSDDTLDVFAADARYVFCANLTRATVARVDKESGATWDLSFSEHDERGGRASWEPGVITPPRYESFLSNEASLPWGHVVQVVVDANALYLFTQERGPNGYQVRAVRVDKGGGRADVLASWSASYGPFHMAMSSEFLYIDFEPPDRGRRCIARIPKRARGA